MTHLNRERLLTAHDIALILGVTTRTVQRWSAAGIFPRPLRHGTRWTRWRSSDLQKFLADRVPTAPPSAPFLGDFAPD